MAYDWSRIEQFCLLCDEPCGSGHAICPPCEVELPWLGPHCTICALPLPQNDLVCGACLRQPPPFGHVAAPWRFAFPLDSLISRFKHRGDWPTGRILADYLARHLEHAYAQGLPRPHRLLPVPLARQRLRQRGFNQSELLADWLGRAVNIAQAPHWLQRLRETPAQQGLDAAARRRNLHEAFGLAPATELTGQHLAVVDDVLTTGATATAVAHLLKRHGAARVDIYCLARTPPPGNEQR